MPNPPLLPSLRGASRRSNPSPALSAKAGDGLLRYARNDEQNILTSKTLFLKPARASERGNVFMFILIGIVLFAALGMTVSRGFQSSTTSNLSKREAELAASEIVNYAQSVERGIQRLRRKGCSENDISFQRDADSDGNFNDNDEDYYNSNAPTDHSCHAFHPDGGNIKYVSLQPKWLNEAFSANYSYGEPIFTGSVRIENLGNNTCLEADSVGCELLMMFGHLKPEIAEHIQNKLLNTTTLTSDGGITNFQPLAEDIFKGTFGFQAVAGTAIGNTDTTLEGQLHGCSFRTTSTLSGHMCHFTLIVR